MLIAGLFIVFVFNIAQIGNQLFSIASEVEVNAFQGFDHFVEGGKDALESNFGGAVQYFDSAGYAFEEAQKKVWFIGNNGMIGTDGSLVKNAYTMLEAGEHISSARIVLFSRCKCYAGNSCFIYRTHDAARRGVASKRDFINR